MHALQSRSWLLLWLALAFPAPIPAAPAPVPVIYGTDLFHPHVDPDDHFDLATLLALPELDVKAILLDQGDRQLQRPGTIPLRQMLRLTGRKVAYAPGLGRTLASPADDGRDQPAGFQGAVDLLLKSLRESPEPVTLIMAGSVRDVCAAWNRDPALLRQKVGRLYLNIGNSEDGGSEYNVELDPKAYAGLLRSGLPIYLCFCLPMKREAAPSEFSTWWHFRQAEVIETAPKGLQAYFIYALQRPAPDELDPIQALRTDLRPWRRLVWEMDRNMWCTAPFLHAAGRTVRLSNGTWTCARPAPAGAPAESVFTFVPARVEVDDSGKTRKFLNDPHPNVQLFKVTATDRYTEAMRDCLRELLRGLPVVGE
jgi:inosine-uridine nucleoside N-ribohydrolase